MRRALVAAAAVALLLPAAALAHVTVSPAFLEDGKRSTLTFASPNERPGSAITAFTVTAPAGIELTPVSPPSGWKTEITGTTATWSGGRIAPDAEGHFRIAAQTTLEPTALFFHAVQRYDDGATAPWTIAFTILPAANAPKEHLWPAFLAGVIGVVVIVGGLAFIRLRLHPNRTS